MGEGSKQGPQSQDGEDTGWKPEKEKIPTDVAGILLQ